MHISIFRLAFVAQHAGLGLTWPETPQTGVFASRPIIMLITLVIHIAALGNLTRMSIPIATGISRQAKPIKIFLYGITGLSSVQLRE